MNPGVQPGHRRDIVERMIPYLSQIDPRAVMLGLSALAIVVGARVISRKPSRNPGLGVVQRCSGSMMTAARSGAERERGIAPVSCGGAAGCCKCSDSEGNPPLHGVVDRLA